MSIQQNFPAISPSLNLNFARSKTLDPRITFSRTSTATRVNEQGLIEVVGADTPRFDHSYDPVSGTVRSLGLLIEEQRENLLRYSEEADNPAWNIFNSSIIVDPNSTTSPDGNQTADKVQEAAIEGGHSIEFTGFAFQQDITYTVSFFAKAAERTRFRIVWPTMFTNRIAFVDIDTSTYGVISDGGTITNIYPFGNGWFRIVSTSTCTTTTTGSRVSITLVDTGTNVNYTGDGTSGIYIWGAQLEVGAFPTSYIPTSGSTATRTTDNVSMVGHNFSGWYNQSEGTVYADTRMVGVQTGRYDRLWAITNSNLNFEGISLYVSGIIGSTYRSSITITNSATEQVGGALVETALTTPQLKSAFAFKQNNCASSYNGQQRFVDNIVDLSTFTTPPDRLLIGQPQRFQGYSCMTVSQLTYYPRRLTNTQLQNLTK